MFSGQQYIKTYPQRRATLARRLRSHESRLLPNLWKRRRDSPSALKIGSQLGQLGSLGPLFHALVPHKVVPAQFLRQQILQGERPLLTPINGYVIIHNLIKFPIIQIFKAGFSGQNIVK